jgi:hypothetical protein
MSHSFAFPIMGVDVHPFLPRKNVTRQTRRRPHRAPNQQPSTPQTALYLHASSWCLAPPTKVLAPLKRCNLHVAFALHIMGVECHPWSSSHAYMTSKLTPPGALHRPSTKYSFNGPSHDACEEEKDGIRRPLCPLLASWDWNRFVSLQLGRVSPKSIWIASSSNPFATMYIRMVALWIWVRLEVWSSSSSVHW